MTTKQKLQLVLFAATMSGIFTGVVFNSAVVGFRTLALVGGFLSWRLCEELTAASKAEGYSSNPEQCLAAIKTRGAGSRCPICGDSVSGRAVKCKRCGVLHHSECFGYNGRCGIFGCWRR